MPRLLRTGLHAADQGGQHPACLVVTRRLVCTASPVRAQSQPRQIRRPHGRVGADQRLQHVVSHHGALELPGRRVLGRQRIARLVPSQFRGINPEDLGQGHEHAVTVDLPEAALNLGQPALRPAS
jgi:hypothetical protein